MLSGRYNPLRIHKTALCACSQLIAAAGHRYHNIQRREHAAVTASPRRRRSACSSGSVGREPRRPISLAALAVVLAVFVVTSTSLSDTLAAPQLPPTAAPARMNGSQRTVPSAPARNGLPASTAVAAVRPACISIEPMSAAAAALA